MAFAPAEPKRNHLGHVEQWIVDGIKHIAVRTSPDGAVTLIAHVDEFQCKFPALTADTAETLGKLLLASAVDVRGIEQDKRDEAARIAQIEQVDG
jgi:hypothetical protein